MLGWRKLGAWFLVYALVVAATLAFKTEAGVPYEIPANNVDLIKWVTGFFFGANTLVHAAKSFSVNVGTPK